LILRSVIENRKDKPADAIVVGAGLAGAAAAAVLGKQGRNVILVDSRQTSPAVFKAEKIEPDQVELLRKIGLFDAVLPHARRVREIRSYYNGRLFRTISEEQYGLSYSDMVNPLREQMPANVQFKMARVTGIDNTADLQRVTLESGEDLTARLVILACGVSGEIPAALGLKRVVHQKHHCVAVAFNIVRPNGRRFDFDSATCYPESSALGVDYLTFFPIRDTMRANLFAFPAADDGWTRRFLRSPEAELEKSFPNLRQAIGGFRIEGKVETSIIHLYGTKSEPLPGVALIGDAAQNACPSTGMGLSKVLNDVDLLCCEHAPRWFETAGMGVRKLAQFCNDPRKCAIDEKALRGAIYRRQARTDKSMRWKIHRKRLHFAMRFEYPEKPVARPVVTECEAQM
jgi:2-polyprenyl-6-methoxyphenol hydroxylase-like FAD-dependent oxidoreductase